MPINEEEDQFALLAASHSTQFSDNEYLGPVDLNNQTHDDGPTFMDKYKQASKEIQEEWAEEGQVWNEESERLTNEMSRLAKKMEELDAKLFKLNEKAKNAENLLAPCITKKRFVISRNSRLYYRSMRP